VTPDADPCRLSRHPSEPVRSTLLDNEIWLVN
jgi:hypothetical protein